MAAPDARAGDGPPSRRAKLPKAFGSLTILRRLNVTAMGSSLAAATATTLALIMGSPSESGIVALTTGLPTLLLGLLWAVLLRSRKTVGKSKVRWGWVLSVPLAMLNAGIACGLLLASESGSDTFGRLVLGGLAGATFGVIVWLPALVSTIAFFGLPVSWSQSLAEKGLAGEEKGERLLGIASTLLALIAVAGHARWGRVAEFPRHAFLDMLGMAFLWIAPAVALVAGVAAASLAYARERRRRKFVEEVEAGRVEGFRVEQQQEGKVLLRVSTLGPGGAAYRVANFEEEVFALDDEGGAKEARRAMALPRRGVG